jgi:predicted CxxxxCH...CXXCH cytochrome family protein
MGRQVSGVAAAVLAAAFGMAACGKSRDFSAGSTAVACTGCHGDRSRTPASIAPAPPIDARGGTDSSSPGVGAHHRHLTGGSIRAGLASDCSDCHVRPTDTQHAGEPLRLSWGSLATAGGVSPSFDPGRLTCWNYCHGATLEGGTNTRPIWNATPDTQAGCGACHGLPPLGPDGTHHGWTVLFGQPLSRANCYVCHAGTVAEDGNVMTSGGFHVNGVTDLELSRF